ncbi:MAG TPA: DEAD/DEAH box helicase, partial [Fibrobacteria bacterium]|nr:DEAD/DEAH box helicase [Fibrobacteria bacterium]
MLFRDLNLNPTILAALQAKGYEKPTPIQAGAIPAVLEERDVWGCAQTGTGKTAAFALPILHNLASRPFVKTNAVRALVLSPTRELALQIAEQFIAYGKGLRLRTAVIFGGVSDYGQKQRLKQGVEILVATPGRLMDLLGQNALNLNHVEIFTLDEADRMLDMGFIHDVRRVSALLPPKRQTLLFSATMPPEIKALAKNLLRDPVNVEVNPVSSTAAKIEQSVYHVSRNLKPTLLGQLLQDTSIRSALVFTRTKHGADKVVRALDRFGVFAEAIHGNKSQGARQRALSNFKAGRTRVLVATDIASRGIDVQEISHVFNYDLPEVAESYVHRIGRTGRNGASGTAVAFCDQEERSYLRQIERVTRTQLPVMNLPEMTPPPPLSADAARREEDRDARPQRGQGAGSRSHRDGDRPARAGSHHGGNRGPSRSYGSQGSHGSERSAPRTYGNPAAARAQANG